MYAFGCVHVLCFSPSTGKLDGGIRLVYQYVIYFDDISFSNVVIFEPRLFCYYSEPRLFGMHSYLSGILLKQVTELMHTSTTLVCGIELIL